MFEKKNKLTAGFEFNWFENVPTSSSGWENKITGKERVHGAETTGKVEKHKEKRRYRSNKILVTLISKIKQTRPSAKWSGKMFKQGKHDI